MNKAEALRLYLTAIQTEWWGDIHVMKWVALTPGKVHTALGKLSICTMLFWTRHSLPWMSFDVEALATENQKIVIDPGRVRSHHIVMGTDLEALINLMS